MITTRRLFLQLSIPAMAALACGCGSDSSGAISPTSNAPGGTSLAQLVSRSDRDIAFFLDPLGNLFEINQRSAEVSKFDPQGKLLWRTTLKGIGPLQVDTPVALTVDSGQRIWLLDRALSKVLLLNPQGQPLQILVPPPDLLRPQDIVAGLTEIFISDGYLHRILVFSQSGQFLRQIGANGQLNFPRGLALDAAGRVHVVDAGTPRILVFSPQGQLLTTYGEGLFRHPRGLDISRDGLIAVSDGVSQRISIFSPDLALVGSFNPSWQGQTVAPWSYSLRPRAPFKFLRNRWYWSDVLFSRGNSLIRRRLCPPRLGLLRRQFDFGEGQP
jgi:streptogramin lyase